MNKREFLEILEIAEVTPFGKKANLFEKDYRPISILPSVSKVYERIMHKQGMDFFINKLNIFKSKYLNIIEALEKGLKLITVFC